MRARRRSGRRIAAFPPSKLCCTRVAKMTRASPAESCAARVFSRIMVSRLVSAGFAACAGRGCHCLRSLGSCAGKGCRALVVGDQLRWNFFNAPKPRFVFVGLGFSEGNRNVTISPGSAGCVFSFSGGFFANFEDCAPCPGSSAERGARSAAPLGNRKGPWSASLMNEGTATGMYNELRALPEI